MLTFGALQEKKSKIKINPKKEDCMEAKVKHGEDCTCIDCDKRREKDDSKEPTVEGVVDVVKGGIKRHKEAVQKKKIKNRKAVPYAALAAEHQPEGDELKEYSPNVTYQAKGGKKSGKLGKSSVYSLRGKDESKKDFRKSHTKDIKDGLLKKEEVEQVDEFFGMFGGGKKSKQNIRSSGGPNNPVLKGARNLLGNRKNVAPAAKFYQAQMDRQKLIQQMMMNQEVEHEDGKTIQEDPVSEQNVGSYDSYANKPGAFSLNLKTLIGKGSNQKKSFSFDVGGGNSRSSIFSKSSSSYSGGDGTYRGNEVGSAINQYNMATGQGGWTKDEIAKEVKKEQDFQAKYGSSNNKQGITRTGTTSGTKQNNFKKLLAMKNSVEHDEENFIDEERSARRANVRAKSYKQVKAEIDKKDAAKKKSGKGEYAASYGKKETDVTDYGDDKPVAKKKAPAKKKAVAAVKKATPKAAPKKSTPKAKAKPAPKKAAPKKAATPKVDKKAADIDRPKGNLSDKARDWIKKGMKRHRKATQGARVFGKGFAKGVKTAVKVAKDVKKVVSEEDIRLLTMGQYLEEKPVLGSQSTTAQAKLQAKLASGASKLQKKLSGSGVVAAESDRTAEVTRLPEQEELPEYLENNYVGREHSEKVATGPRLGEPRKKGATHPNAGEGEKIQKRTLKWMRGKGMQGAPGLKAMQDREAEHRARNKSRNEEVELSERKSRLERTIRKLKTGRLKDPLAGKTQELLDAGKKFNDDYTKKYKKEDVEVAESKGHKYDDSFIEGETGSKVSRRNLTRAMSSTTVGMGKGARGKAEDSAKRRERHQKDRNVKTKGTKAGHSGSAYPKMSKTLDDQYPHKKTYRLKQKAAARKAGKKYEDDTHYSLKKKTVGEKLPKPKNESVEIDEATRLKKEKGYTKGGTKKPSGKPTAMSVVLDKIRKEHGHGAVVGQGGSRQKKKEKGAKSTAGTGKYLKRAKEKAAYAAKAKKAGFKNTQDYTNTMAVYGGEANYKSGKGLDT